jgi:hypothetical protein
MEKIQKPKDGTSKKEKKKTQERDTLAVKSTQRLHLQSTPLPTSSLYSSSSARCSRLLPVPAQTSSPTAASSLQRTLRTFLSVSPLLHARQLPRLHRRRWHARRQHRQLEEEELEKNRD